MPRFDARWEFFSARVRHLWIRCMLSLFPLNSISMLYLFRAQCTFCFTIHFLGVRCCTLHHGWFFAGRVHTWNADTASEQQGKFLSFCFIIIGVFNWLSKVILRLFRFCFTTLWDWLAKTFAPLSQPTRSKTKILSKYLIEMKAWWRQKWSIYMHPKRA